MKRFTFFAAMLSLSLVGIKPEEHNTIVYHTYQVDPNMPDTFTFPLRWDYPWWTIRNDDGSFENTAGNAISAQDTAHLYFTADCTSDHQGEHAVQYGYAKIEEDLLTLSFRGGEPAYFDRYFIYIKKNEFGAAMDVSYIFPSEHIRIDIRTLSQELLLDRSEVKAGDTIKGKVDVSFLETHSEKKQIIYQDTIRFHGYFKIPVEKQF